MPSLAGFMRCSPHSEPVQVAKYAPILCRNAEQYSCLRCQYSDSFPRIYPMANAAYGRNGFLLTPPVRDFIVTRAQRDTESH